MTLGRASSGAIKIKTDGGLRAVECACCVPPCPEITINYTVISKEMYDALLNGGNYVVNGALSEVGPNGGCNLSQTKTGTTSGCIQSFFISNKTCSNPNNPEDPFSYASISITLYISKVGNEYRLSYSGSGWCPSYDVNYGLFPCYSFGWYILWIYDNGDPPNYFENHGSVTINTSAGTLGPYGIWSFPFAAQNPAYLDVIITPFAP